MVLRRTKERNGHFRRVRVDVGAVTQEHRDRRDIAPKFESKASSGGGSASLTPRGGHLIQIVHRQDWAIRHPFEDRAPIEILDMSSAEQYTILRKEYYALNNRGCDTLRVNQSHPSCYVGGFRTYDYGVAGLPIIYLQLISWHKNSDIVPSHDELQKRCITILVRRPRRNWASGQGMWPPAS